MTLGEKIVFYRKQFKFTQDVLAEKLNVSRQAVSKWERDAAFPDGDNLYKLAKIFGIPIELLLENTGIEQSEIIQEKKDEVEILPKKKWKIIVPIIFLITVLIISVVTLLINNLSGEQDKSVKFKKIMMQEEVVVKQFPIVSGGRYFYLVLNETGTVDGVGENQYGQLDVQNWNNIIAISAGGYHSLGLRKDGTVIATGNNEYGQLNVNNWLEIIQISAGRYHSVGLREDGSVVCVGGESKYNQCNMVSSWNNIKQVSAGRYGTVGLKEDGTLVYAGTNIEGLANFSNWDNIVQVSAGTYHTVGLTKEGTVVCVGRTGNGSCNVSSWTDIVEIVTGGYHTLGLKDDGTVVSTGSNESNQLSSTEWNTIQSISAGRLFSIVVTKDKEIIVKGILNSSTSKQIEEEKDNTVAQESNTNQEVYYEERYDASGNVYLYIRWPEVENATSYIVSLEGQSSGDWHDTKYPDANFYFLYDGSVVNGMGADGLQQSYLTMGKQYIINIIAMIDLGNGNHSEQKIYNFEYKIKKINLLVEKIEFNQQTKIVSWEGSPNTKEFEVFIGILDFQKEYYQYELVTTDQHFNLEDICNLNEIPLEEGYSISIKVVAKGYDSTYIDSKEEWLNFEYR